MSANKILSRNLVDTRRGLFQGLAVNCHIAPQIFTVLDYMQLYAVVQSVLT